ncbi:Phosphotyrosyl phosphatase activator [Dentipellis sp. KUC8613]|nr:Phosphotyrosyl phosphatase activator [Dentipellis sp. KUC8613]
MATHAPSLAPLREVAVADLVRGHVEAPTTKIKTDADVEYWRHTRGYRDYGVFLRRLNESVVGLSLPFEEPPSAAVQAVVTMLDTLDGWIDEIPPQPTPQRFGNLAFRTWGKRLEDSADDVLAPLLPDAAAALIPHLKPYLLTSFGSFVRMDYGTGHETSFAMLLLCLTLLRFLQPTPAEERQIVLTIFLRYLRLCWRLQDVYNLEPAGSHGVWGLDDSHFLPYVFGSGQLRDQNEIPVDAVLRPPLPPTNLYFMSIMRIHEVKHGPFHEHSSQLYAIATGVAHWGKVNSGLFKMYEAEVLGKRVVVQHLPLGGLVDWHQASAPPIPVSASAAAAVAPSWTAAPAPTPLGGAGTSTRAPWAATGPRAYAPSATAAPWSNRGGN